MSRYIIIACALAAILIGPALAARAASKEDLARWVDQMPKDDPDHKYSGLEQEVAQKVYDEILKGGKDAVVGLVALMPDPGKGEEYKVKYLIHGLVTYAARPGAEQDRRMVCDALLAAIGTSSSKYVQGFCIQELEPIGSKDTSAALGKFLLDDDLYAPAARALQSFGDPAPLRQALPAAKGRARVAVILALGAMRDAASVPDIKKATTDADRDTRIAALDALGNIGEAAGIDPVLAGMAAAKDTWELTRACDDALVLAKRRIEAGDKAGAEIVYRKLWEVRTEPEQRHVRIGAMLGLAAVRGDMNDLFAGAKTGDPQIRAAAAQAAAAIPGQTVTAQCIQALEKAASPDKAGLLDILGARRDPTAMPAVLAALKDFNEPVRVAAAHAAASIGGQQAAEALVTMASTTTGKDREDAIAALGKMRGKEADDVAAAAMVKAQEPAVRAALLGVLAAHHDTSHIDAVLEALTDKDISVRVAALKALGVLAGDKELPMLVKLAAGTKDKAELDAAEEALVAACARQMGDKVADQVVPALEGAAPANAVAMLHVLGAAAGKKALDAVVACTKSSDADLKEAAVRTLADWRNKDAAVPLLDVAQNSDVATHRVLALRGAVRLASISNIPDADKLKILTDAMKAAKRPEDKRQVLGGLSKVQTLGSLKVAAACMDDDAVKEEAAAAVVQIAGRITMQIRDAVRDPVAKAAKVAKSDQVKAAAEELLGPARK